MYEFIIIIIIVIIIMMKMSVELKNFLQFKMMMQI